MENKNFQGNFKRNIQEFKESVYDLKEKLNKLLKMCDSTDFKQNEAFDTLQDGLVNLIEIKYLNSEVQKDLENFKEQTAKEREKAEEKNLNYQNYLYQKDIIASQINFCSNFPTEEMDKIKFSEKEKVIDYFKSNGIEVEEAKLDTMDYLKYELEMRQILDQKVKTLSQYKESNETKLHQKEKYFRELPSYFKDLEMSTFKAQSYLNLNMTSNYSDSILSQKLPQPLFVLYNSLLCVDKTNIQYELKIIGREEDIDEFYKNYPIENINFNLKAEHKSEINSRNVNTKTHHFDNKEEGEHTDSGELMENEVIDIINENSKTSLKDDRIKTKFIERKTRRKKSENKKKNSYSRFDDSFFKGENQDELNIINVPKIKKFPLSLHLEIRNFILDSNSDQTANMNILPICINFYYLPIFNIVTTEVISNNSHLTSNLTTNIILSNLFVPPANLLSSFKAEINKAVNFLCEESSSNEKFFDYVQILSNNVNYNLTYLKKICDLVKNKNLKNKAISQELTETKESYYDNPSKITADNFISLMIERIAYSPSLLNQIDFLLKSKKILPEAVSESKKEKRFNLIKEKTIITDVTKLSQNEFLKIFEKKYDNDFSEENFKLLSVFEKDEEGNYFKKYLKVPITFYTEDEANYLCITLERKTAKMKAYIEVGMDYPSSHPKFLLEIIADKPRIIENIHKKLLSDSNDLFVEMAKGSGEIANFTKIIREIEKEINEFSHEFCPKEAKQYLLSYQIRMAVMCFDIFYEIQNNKTNSAFVKNTKGNKKNMPFRFNERKSLFEAR